MITYVNSKEAKLFELAAEDLHMERNSLDLEQYLKSLDTLKSISPKYVRLPLYEDGHEDEEIFEIDANARTIKVPASFKKNGVGVVSDQLAETVWFKINRYFDIKDFGKASEVEELKDGDLHILIQWEAPDKAKGASWAYAIDADTDPEYIYFGWALTADHLTAQAGNIKFAIRIMQYRDGDDENKEIIYSFATQAATVAVKPSLDFDLTDNGIVIEQVADKISSTLMDGEIAYCPVFDANGDLPSYILNLEAPREGADPQAVLQVSVNPPKKKNPETGELEPGDPYKMVAYKWYKKGADEEEFSLVPADGNNGQFTPALTVTSSGEYYVVVFGMREIVDNKEFVYDETTHEVEEKDFKYHSSVASSRSTICEIPAPKKLQIFGGEYNSETEKFDAIAKAVIIEADAALIINIERQTIADNVVGDVSLAIGKTESGAKLTEEQLKDPALIFNEVEIFNLADVREEVRYSAEEAAAELARATEAGEEPAFVEGDVKIPAVVAPDDKITYSVNDGLITINMEHAAQGYYQIAIINHLNGDEKVSPAEDEEKVICRVVKPASLHSAEISIIGTPAADGRGSITNGNELQVTYDLNGELSDEIEYAWYIISSGKDPDDSDPDELIEGANGPVYKPTARGSYYAKVVNKVEDTQFEITTNDIEFA